MEFIMEKYCLWGRKKAIEGRCNMGNKDKLYNKVLN